MTLERAGGGPVQQAHPPALLMYSGGLDSVQALYARCVVGLPTRTHHVRLKNWNGRSVFEQKAVTDTLAWLRRRFPKVSIEHTTSTFDYGDLRYIVKDHNVWGLMAGIILADPKNDHITRVVRTFHRDSVVGGLESPAGRPAEHAWRTPIDHLTGRRAEPVEFLYPQLGMSKADIVAALPPDLMRLCWYCRIPKHGRPCHECHTCRQVDAALRGDDWVPLDERK